MEKVEASCNTGIINGTYGVGGIAGEITNKSAEIYNCYNRGSITGTGINNSDTSSNFGVGGVVGALVAYLRIVQSQYKIVIARELSVQK